MAYATGTGANITDLMDALRSFAVAQGWTVDKWDSANRQLFMTKGLCAVTMQGRIDATVRIYTGANNANIFTDGNPDHRLYFALNTSNTAGLTTYHSHPGSRVTSNYEGDSPYVARVNGPYVAWHFFADAAVSDHIHCIIQTGAETYQHFSFGHLDKQGLTHSGVAYVMASANPDYRNSSSYTNQNGSNTNNHQYVSLPFAYANNNNPVASHEGSPGIILKHVDAWPATWDGPIVAASGANPHFGTMLPMLNPLTIDVTGPVAYPSNGNRNAHLLSPLFLSEPTPYSNITPMFSIPCFRNYNNTSVSNSRRICYLGEFPNVRMINMTNLTPGQEITLAGDTWKIFPALRQAPWTDSNVLPQVTSGQFGYAYKKV